MRRQEKPKSAVAANQELEATQVTQPARPSSTTATRKRPKKTRAVDPAAEKLYLRGRAQWNKRHPDAIRQAIALFQEAVEIDPMHASSYAGLADAYMMLGFLQRALDDRASWLWHTPLEPRFDSLRTDPRFRELVSRYGLEAAS